jgi:pimeloyl-ACP methyl ester carboxylesterase
MTVAESIDGEAADPLGFSEEPVYLAAGDDVLFGVFVAPDGPSRGAVTLFPGAGQVTAAHRNAMFSRLARSLAGHQWSSLRMDYRGCGESSGTVEIFRLDDPHRYAAQAALSWLGQRGIESHVLVGTCFGARTLLSAAPDLDGLRGIVLVSPPIRDFAPNQVKPSAQVGTLRRLGRLAWGARLSERRKKYWRFVRGTVQLRVSALWTGLRTLSKPRVDVTSTSLLGLLEHLARRQVPVLIFYGDTDREYEDFCRATEGRLGDVLNASPSTQLLVIPGPVHGFERLSAQDAVVDAIMKWVTDLDEPDHLGEADAATKVTSGMGHA